MITEILNYFSQCSAGVLVVYYCLFIVSTYILFSFLYDFDKLDSEDVVFNSFGIILLTPVYFLFFMGKTINNIISFIKFLFRKRFN